jgi:hypothetical protein
LKNASTAEIQNVLFERGMVAIPLDWMTDYQRGLLIEQNKREANRDFRHADALSRLSGEVKWRRTTQNISREAESPKGRRSTRRSFGPDNVVKTDSIR